MSTIKDVAKAANVSTGTVSRYLNGYKIKSENKQKIEKAITELNYISNPIARSLRSKKSKTIGVVIPRITDIFGTQVIEAIEERMDESGYSVIICSSNDSIENQNKKLEYLKYKMVDGIVIMPVSTENFNIDEIISAEIPVVLIDRVVRNYELDSILSDNVNGAYEAIETIINRGHKDIAIIAGPKEINTAEERLTGFYRAMQDYGLEVQEEYVLRTEYKKDGGIDAIKKLMKLQNLPTVIFTTNYPITVNSIKTLGKMGYKIGDDISLCGYDQTDLFEILSPPISVVVQPGNEIGKQSAEVLLKRMNNDYSNFNVVKRLKTKLIATKSIKVLN